MTQNAWRVELELLPSRKDPLGAAATATLNECGLPLSSDLRVGRGYLLPPQLNLQQVETIASRLLADKVNEVTTIVAPDEKPNNGTALLVRRMPGVSDPEAETAMRALQLLEIDLQGLRLETYRSYRCLEDVDQQLFLKTGGNELANLTIEEAVLNSADLSLHPTPTPRQSARREVEVCKLNLAQLEDVSREMSLALTGEEMQAVQNFFVDLQREPTDAELETLAQTWSEHCKHKTLTGPVDFKMIDSEGNVVQEKHYDNLLKETVFAATETLSPEWCWSVFKDNAGVIAMTDEIGIAVKVETHNHPSALDPYGGAGTGIGGCIRDILGTGLGARPFASTDVFCVGPEDIADDMIPPGTMHPNRVLEGVIAGVRDYGNRMGIPTVAGTIIRHPGYVANPLVFAGSIGEIPRKYVDKAAIPGDLIVAFGGRTGRDGIHGATFSSEALHEDSESVDSAAVQIGDPITEKKVLDLLLEARDADLFNAVTDCGAGGFSSAVGEMGEEIGAEVDLDRAPLKYAGLDYWEIWISEAQERMIASVDKSNLDHLQQLCDKHDVELTVLGTFADHQRLILRWHGEVVGDMPMQFLHGGVPQPLNFAVATYPPQNATAWPETFDCEKLLLDTLAHPSVASKEYVVRQYDHEVQGGTVLKPYQGANGNGPGDGTVVKPRLDLPHGVAIGCGIAPRMSELDAYAGAANAIDEAMRNVVAAGGNPHRTAILDNFCWGDCRKPDRLGSLVLAAQACHDVAVAYGTPFISGKDSLNNEYRVGDEEVAIPPTLLCTATAIVDDCEKTVGTAPIAAGNLIVQIGLSTTAGGASVASDLLELADSIVPRPNCESAVAIFDALHQAIGEGLVSSCHDLCEGGLAAAAAEMVIGADGLGVELDSNLVPTTETLNNISALFAEAPTRFIAEISPQNIDRFGEVMRGNQWSTIGQITDTPQLELKHDGNLIYCAARDVLATANQVPA